MSKWIIVISIMGCLLWPFGGAAQEDSVWARQPLPLWGLSFQDVSLLMPGFNRTPAGLTAFQRTRIARFMKQVKVHDHPARLYFSFKSNRLYEAEYDFQKPDTVLRDRLLADLTRQFGPPSRQGGELRPAGEPFVRRDVWDLSWETPRARVNLRYALNVFSDGRTVPSLFVTLRETVDSKPDSGDRPRQLVSDEEALTGGAEVLLGIGGSLSFRDLSIMNEPIEDSAQVRLDLSELETIWRKADVMLMPVSDVKGDWRRDLNRRGVDGVWRTTRGMLETSNENQAVPPRVKRQAGIELFNSLSAEVVAADVVDVKGLRLGLLAVAPPESAMKDKPGNPADSAYFRQLSQTAQRIVRNADLLVVWIDWGDGQRDCIDTWQRNMVQTMFDAGAVLVVGAAGDRVLGVHEQGSHVALFSVGRLLPDNRKPGEAKESLIFWVTLNKMGILGYDVVPVRTTKVLGMPVRPVPLKGDAKRLFMKKFAGFGKNCER